MARDSEEFVGHVEKILDPVFAKTIGSAARQRVLDLYSWRDSLGKYDRLLGD